MRRRIFAAVATGLALAGGGAAQAADPPAFKPIRSDEDYSYLKSRPVLEGGDRLRFLPLTEDGETYLTLGGEARLRVDSFDAPRFGLGGAQADVYGLGRALFSADLHLGSRLRVYGELGLHRDIGKKDPPAISDRDGLDAQVAFVDLTPDAARRWRLRLGRQEVSLNPTQRFVSVREGPNIRQSFDGLRVTRQTPGLRLEAFYLRPVVIQTGAFDDSRNADQRFYGVYASRPLNKAVTLDLYAIALERDGVRFGGVRGDERRTSLGARLAGKRGAIDYEAEGMVQGGRFAGRDIRAWGGSLGGGYTLARAWSPRLGLRLDAGSGDSNASDGRLETFNPLFPKGAYFNETGLTSWSNLLAVRPSLGLAPRRDVSLEVSYLIRRRQTGDDAIYLQPSTPLAPVGADRSWAVGDAAQLDATWQVNRNLKLQAQLVHQSAGDAIQAVNGRAVDFGMLIAQFRF
ncbi:alginate export family protein [Caulobacter sp. AP07]|uniref:alginate export family protein n=1 Tax=Caulobacter sp. AP07 TaxID=1144304 RepID=UPI0012FA478C|nr:alginate export family protein [Caulobacter sp. AP07]